MPATACQDVDGRRWHGSGTPTPLLLQQTTDTQQGATIAMMWGSRVLQQHPDALAGSTHHLGAAWLVVKKGRGLGRAEALQPPANCQTLSRFVCLFVRATNGLQTKVVSIYVWFLQLWSVGSINRLCWQLLQICPSIQQVCCNRGDHHVTLGPLLLHGSRPAADTMRCSAQTHPKRRHSTPRTVCQNQSQSGGETELTCLWKRWPAGARPYECFFGGASSCRHTKCDKNTRLPCSLPERPTPEQTRSTHRHVTTIMYTQTSVHYEHQGALSRSVLEAATRPTNQPPPPTPQQPWRSAPKAWNKGHVHASARQHCTALCPVHLTTRDRAANKQHSQHADSV